jgi:hypothetical protein
MALDFPRLHCSEWLFLAGSAVIALSAVWTIAGRHSPPGLLGLARGEAGAEPDAPTASFWLDRFIHPRNVWLTAGLVALAASFVLLFVL